MFYKMMTVLSVLFRIETSVLKQKDYFSLTAAEMFYLRSVRGCTFTQKILGKN